MDVICTQVRRFQRERCSFFPSVLEASAAIAAAANNLWREVSTVVEREADADGGREGGRADRKEGMVYVGEGNTSFSMT